MQIKNTSLRPCLCVAFELAIPKWRTTVPTRSAACQAEREKLRPKWPPRLPAPTTALRQLSPLNFPYFVFLFSFCKKRYLWIEIWIINLIETRFCYNSIQAALARLDALENDNAGFEIADANNDDDDASLDEEDQC